MKELIKTKLEKYEYKFLEDDNLLSIKMGLSLYINVEFRENGRIRISDKLKGWNFLTGMLSMSVKSSLIYQTIGLVVAAFLLLFLAEKSENLLFTFLFILVGFSGWIILWSFYFLFKSENMKKQIIFWLEQPELKDKR